MLVEYCAHHHVLKAKFTPEWTRFNPCEFFLLFKISRNMLSKADILSCFYISLLKGKPLPLAGWCLSEGFVVGGRSVPHWCIRVFILQLFDRNYWGVVSMCTMPFRLLLLCTQMKEGLWNILMINKGLVVKVVNFCFFPLPFFLLKK